jgi:hypothetical protein
MSPQHDTSTDAEARRRAFHATSGKWCDYEGEVHLLHYAGPVRTSDNELALIENPASGERRWVGADEISEIRDTPAPTPQPDPFARVFPQPIAPSRRRAYGRQARRHKRR